MHRPILVYNPLRHPLMLPQHRLVSLVIIRNVVVAHSADVLTAIAMLGYMTVLERMHVRRRTVKGDSTAEISSRAIWREGIRLR